MTLPKGWNPFSNVIFEKLSYKYFENNVSKL
jgi:hypothetical protein